MHWSINYLVGESWLTYGETSPYNQILKRLVIKITETTLVSWDVMFKRCGSHVHTDHDHVVEDCVTRSLLNSIETVVAKTKGMYRYINCSGLSLFFMNSFCLFILSIWRLFIWFFYTDNCGLVVTDCARIVPSGSYTCVPNYVEVWPPPPWVFT